MLFKDSQTLKLFAQLSGTINLNDVKVTMERVELEYLRPRLGKELFTSLTTSYELAANDTAFGTALQKKLLDYCRRVTGPMFCYHFAPKADVQVSSSGIQRSENSTIKTAFQYQGTKYREENFNEGHAAIESLLEFLEDNITDLPEWKNSAEFKQYRSLFIKTGSEFNQYYSSPTPQRNFYAMRPKMIDVEENGVRPFLGDAMFDAIKSKDQLQTPGFTEKETKLLAMIKKAIAYYTVSFSVPLLSVKIDGNGITIFASQSFSSSDDDSKRAGADTKALNDLVNSCNNSGQMWLNRAKEFLMNNKADFNSWVGFQVQEKKPCADFTAVFAIY